MRNWDKVYKNQDLILNSLKELKNVFTLGGGTALHRFLLSNKFRYSEDLDLFLDKFLYNKKDIKKITDIFFNQIKKISSIKDIQIKDLNDKEDYRLICYFENGEDIKVDILNFSMKKIKKYNYDFDYFKAENFYDLTLYKISALCGRMESVKDLFDLYFLFQKIGKININQLINDVNSKIKFSLERPYTKDNLLKALEINHRWDIYLIDSSIENDAIQEIKKSQKKLLFKIRNNEELNFSLENRIKERVKELDLPLEVYNEMPDLLEDNKFLLKLIQNSSSSNLKKIEISNFPLHLLKKDNIQIKKQKNKPKL